MTRQTETDKLLWGLITAMLDEDGKPDEVATYESIARSALRAIYEAGYVAVPREPTGDMKYAALEHSHDEHWDPSYEGIYDAMLSASPIKMTETE